MGRQIEVTSDAQRVRPEKSEVERLWADNTKARRLLGWEPAFGGREGFKRGLATTVAWFTEKENAALYKADIYNL
jgi:nucleoside-diphosphate-sugar epimerase